MRLIIISTLTVLLLAGCGQRDEDRHPYIRKARRMAEDSRFAEAVGSYREYLNRYPESPLAHYELASLYREQFDNPLLAIYHYRRFLEISPDSSDAELVQSFIAGAEKQYYRELAEKYAEVDQAKQQISDLKLQEKKYLMRISRLNAENRQLRQQINSRIDTGNQSSHDDEENAENIAAPEHIPEQTPRVVDLSEIPSPDDIPQTKTRRYTVKEGDSLISISRRVYGSGRHYLKIFEANRDQLESPSKLSLGQTLRIPPLDGTE